MRTLGLSVLVLGVIVNSLAAQGHSNIRRASAALDPGHEVPVVISPEASGGFIAVVDEEARTIDYRLTFSGLQAAATQSHIHLAQPDVNGAIVAWLCQTPAAPDTANPNTPQCPVNGGSVGGAITPQDVRVIASQGLAPSLTPIERFDRLVRAIRDGNTYVNVHSAQSPGGEIRGQVHLQGTPHK